MLDVFYEEVAGEAAGEGVGGEAREDEVAADVEDAGTGGDRRVEGGVVDLERDGLRRRERVEFGGRVLDFAIERVEFGAKIGAARFASGSSLVPSRTDTYKALL